MRIVVGIHCADEVRPLIRDGADEFYAGIVPRTWSAKYGYSLSPNRRESPRPNLVEFEELARMSTAVHRAKKRLLLTLNAHDYPSMVLKDIHEIMLTSLSTGVDGIIVADPGLLHAMKHWGIDAYVALSGDYGVSNVQCLRHIQELGIVKRVIFPRDLAIKDMAKIVQKYSCFEFESFVLNERCYFSGAQCMALHGFDRRNFCQDLFSVPWMIDASEELSYEEYERAALATFWMSIRERGAANCNIWGRDECHAVPCDLCALHTMAEIGIKYVKIVSRGVGLCLKRKMVQLVHKVISEDLTRDEIVALYNEAFSGNFTKLCELGINCYRI